MERRWIGLGVGGVAMVVALAWMATPRPDALPTPVTSAPLPRAPTPAGSNGPAPLEDVRSPDVPEDPAGATSVAPLRGPNGRPIEMEPGLELKRQGLPDRPSGAVSDWDAERAAALVRWQNAMEVQTRAFAAGRSEAERADMLEAVGQFTGAVNAVKRDIALGTTPPAEGRQRIAQLRNAMAERMHAHHGDDGAALNAWLQEQIVGGGW